MYKQPLFFEEEKIPIKNNKILIFCIIIAVITIAIIVITGVLTYKMIKNDFGTNTTEQMTGSKTVGIGNTVESQFTENTNTPTLPKEEIDGKEETPSEFPSVSSEDVIPNDSFPKHDFNVAEESQLPKYSEEIAKKVVDVYYEKTKKVYLTFDDGPSRLTDDVLDILDKYNVKATFFVLGANVDANPSLVKRAYDSGHFIASHGYTHKYSKIYTNPQEVLNEYNQSVVAIRNAIGVPNYDPHLFRFPGGSSGGPYNSVKQEAITLLKQNNITYTNWNCLTGDSAGSETIEAMWNELYQTSAGDDNLVVLMHDAGDKDVTVQFLPAMIEKYLYEGYVFTNYYEVMCE